MQQQTLTEDQLGQVTIWYRCSVCFGFIYSVPELKKHLLNAHNVTDYKLPKDAPPDAENGKIYFMNEYFNQSPNALPKRNKSVLPAQRNEYNETSDDILNSSQENDEFDIRLRKLEDLQETLSSDEDESILVLPNLPLTKKTTEEENISSPNEVVSPPDSGISEINEDEVQPVPPNCPTPIVAKTLETLDNSAKTPENTSETKKFQCDVCEKQFPFLGPLNFHMNVKHKPLILTIRRTTAEKDSYTVLRSNQINKPKEDLIQAEKNSTPTQSKESEQSEKSPIKSATVPISAEASSGEREQTNVPNVPASSDKTNDEGEPDNENHDSSSDFVRPKRKRTCVLESSSDVSNESSISYGLRRSLRINTKISQNSSFPSPSSSTSYTKVNETKRGRKNKPEIDEIDSDSDIPPPSLTNYGSSTNNADNDATSSSDSEDLFIAVPPRKNKRRRHSSQPVNNEKNVTSKRKTVETTVCSYCRIECKNGKALINHIVDYHKKKNPKMNCGYCLQQFTDSYEFNRHITIHQTK